MNEIHDSIRHLAVDIATLVPLEGNPRKGNVDAIVASYREFGQVKPVVIRRNDDGTATVIAGNHQVEACRRLGWSQIAAIELTADDARAVAFALADNRTNELGTTDDDLLYEMLEKVDGYGDLLDGLGWDDFEVASMEHDYRNEDDNSYTPPVMVNMDTPSPASPTIAPVVTSRPDGEREYTAPSTVDTSQAIKQGAPSVVTNPTKTIVQYTLVFDSAEQQRKWYDFIRWLKADAGYDGDTTAERLLNFIDSHANY